MGEPIKVLLVDDEPDFTRPLAFWLKSKGYQPQEVTTGEQALKIIKESAPDIIFLDINMPGMDGLATLQKLREFNKDVPVVIVSAYVDDPRARQANDYGVAGMFYKGDDLAEGLTLLETVLRTHKKLKDRLT